METLSVQGGSDTRVCPITLSQAGQPVALGRFLALPCFSLPYLSFPALHCPSLFLLSPFPLFPFPPFLLFPSIPFPCTHSLGTSQSTHSLHPKYCTLTCSLMFRYMYLCKHFNYYLWIYVGLKSVSYMLGRNLGNRKYNIKCDKIKLVFYY